MKSLHEISFAVILIIDVHKIILAAASSPVLLTGNNGPATLGANITFTAELKNYETTSPLTFTFDDGIQKTDYKIQNLCISISRAFSAELYKGRTYYMNVSVEAEYLLWKNVVAVNGTYFDLKRDLIGKILVYRGNVSTGIDVDEVAVGENVTLMVNLSDPNAYLKNAVIDYGWSIDMERHRTLDNTFIYNFTSPGVKQINALATATFPNSDSRSGTFEKVITAKVPVHNVNISGNPFLHHGDLLLLNVSCNGTPPFAYCSEILGNNTSAENFTCSQLSTFTNCHMEIKKFLLDGKYNLGIYISNDVKEVKRVMEIMVYNVTINPTLSTVIIPIVCSLLTLIIIAIGISYCIHQRNHLSVEVANFDFQDESDSYPEKTFFEKIFDSFTCRNCTKNQYSERSESDPLLYEESQPQV